MLEPLSISNSNEWHDAELRNVLDLNFAPDNLGFLSAWLARRARLFRLQELDSGTAIVKVALPVSTPTRVLLPGTTAFMRLGRDDDGPLQAIFGDSLQTRLLVIHEAQSEAFLSRISQSYLPDIVCLEAGTRLPDEWFRRHGLSPRPDAVTSMELRNWGMPSLQFWSNARGAATLKGSLAMFDGFHQRRKQESSRVYDVKELALCEGFYPVESESHNNWAWTGSDTVATLLIPSHGNARLKITLYLFGATIPIDAENVEVFVDDRRCQCQYFGNEKMEISTGQLHEGCAHRVDIVQSRTVSTAEGSRQIGCALHKLKIEVQP